MPFVKVAALSALPEGAVLGVEAAGRRVCLARVDGEVYALADNCTHRDFPLSGGEMYDDRTVSCEWHGARFDVRTGEPVCGPTRRAVATFVTRVEDGSIWVDV